MDRTGAALIVLAILIALVALMVFGWRMRQRRQAELPDPAAPPAELGAVTGTFAGLYVATTLAGQPVNRIAVRGLGYRAKTTLTVARVGIVLPIPGHADILIPTDDIREVTRATWVIDKGVEPNGLSVVGWTLGGTMIDSFFRLEEPEKFASAVTKIIKGNGKRTT